MSGRKRTRRAYVALETGGFAVDPSVDGSGYTPARVSVFDTSKNGRIIFDTDEATGRDRPTDLEPGPDGSEITLSGPLCALAAAAGDGVAPSGTNALFLFFASLFGTAQSVSGEGVASGSTSSTLNTDTNHLSAGQLACVHGAGNSGRSQWRRVVGATSPYTVAPANWVSTPDNADVSYGSYQFRDGAQGYSVALVEVVESVLGSTEIYLHLGGRPTSLSVQFDAKGRATWSVTLRFDSKTEDASAKSALPAIALQTAPAIKGMLSPIFWGSTKTPVKSATFNWNVNVVDDDSTEGVNGRAGIDKMSADPTCVIVPRFSRSTWEADFNAGTARELLVQFGGGVVSSGLLNSWCFGFPRGQVQAADPTDDAGRPRHSVTIKAVDGGASSDLWRGAAA